MSRTRFCFNASWRWSRATLGQLFNATRIGNDCGVNHGTVSRWLSILEASWIAFRLPPHHRSFRKRLVKTPKIYFYDVGLACRLLGIETPEQLATHPLRGPLFENWVITELLKGRFNRRLRSNLFFWRNHTGLEVDVLVEQAGKLMPIEIRSGASVGDDWLAGLEKWQVLAGTDSTRPTLVYGGDVAWRKAGVDLVPWGELGALAERI
jgi:predicted AAA+ superfamily ATPase